MPWPRLETAGDDGMYHQSALERFLKLNVRHAVTRDGVGYLCWCSGEIPLFS